MANNNIEMKMLADQALSQDTNDVEIWADKIYKQFTEQVYSPDTSADSIIRNILGFGENYQYVDVMASLVGLCKIWKLDHASDANATLYCDHKIALLITLNPVTFNFKCSGFYLTYKDGEYNVEAMNQFA